jgi:hypothetical protein
MSVSYGGDSITFADGSVNSSGFIGHRNRIINGAMVIDQRNAGASITPADSQFVVDRFNLRITQASKLTAQQNQGAVTPPAGFTNYLGVTSSSAYAVTASDNFNIVQIIEGYNIADLGFGTANAKTVTLSFWVRSSLTGTFGGSLTNSALDRSYPFSYSIPSANTWTQISVTIAGDTSGTWLTTIGQGIRVWFSLGVGTDKSATAGSWSTNYYNSVTGAVSVVGTNGATFYITGVQLERGSTASSFEYRPYGTELALCQRYFYKNLTSASGSERFQIDTYVTTGVFPLACLSHPVPMRATPTKTKIGAWTGSNINAATVSLAGNELVIAIQADANGTGRGYLYPEANQGWSASAEL